MRYIQLRSSSNDNVVAFELEFHKLPRSAILRYDIPQKTVHDVLKRCRKFASVSSALQVVLFFAH